MFFRSYSLLYVIDYACMIVIMNMLMEYRKKIIFMRSVDFIYEHTQLNVFRMIILLSIVTILMLRNCCVQCVAEYTHIGTVPSSFFIWSEYTHVAYVDYTLLSVRDTIFIYKKKSQKVTKFKV